MAFDSPSHSTHDSSPHSVCRRARSLPLLLAVFWLCVSAVNVRADAEEGAKIFFDKCASCHTVGLGDHIGPDLRGVIDRRTPDWLSRWIQEPDKVLAAQDPVVIQLFNEFDRVVMPNKQVTQAQAESLIAYIKRESDKKPGKAVTRLPESVAPANRKLGGMQSVALVVFAVISIIIITVFGFVAKSTAKPQAVDMKAAYRLRRVLFLSGSAALLSLLAITLPNNPYNVNAEPEAKIIYTTARQFSFTYSREPVTTLEELRLVEGLRVLEVPADTLVEFRVTTLDSTHGFAVYDPNGAIIAQTQAMPGYINRLRIRFDKPGFYGVLCLEYCGAAHHIMRSGIIVR